jgi:hypothetical protein
MATTPFDSAIRSLQELGFFKFLLPFILSAAIFYGLLRKTQLFGPPEKNTAVNATIALTASFFVWSMPVILGVDIETQLAAFFVQGMGVTLVAMVGLLLAGMFLPPDLPKTLSEKFKSGAWMGIIIIGALLIVFILLVSSGLYKIFAPQGFTFRMSGESLNTIGVVLLLVGAVAIIAWGAR